MKTQSGSAKMEEVSGDAAAAATQDSVPVSLGGSTSSHPSAPTQSPAANYVSESGVNASDPAHGTKVPAVVKVSSLIPRGKTSRPSFR